MTRSRRASSTAPANPTAAASSTTTGGGTRSRANASTNGGASGRKRGSHNTPFPRLAFRDCANLDKRSFADGIACLDELDRRVDLAPDVPQQEPARAAFVVDVRDRALAVRLLPRLDGREARVDLADCFVAEVEHVGVEERHVIVRLVRAGHVGADRLAVRGRVVLVLHAEA